MREHFKVAALSLSLLAMPLFAADTTKEKSAKAKISDAAQEQQRKVEKDIESRRAIKILDRTLRTAAKLHALPRASDNDPLTCLIRSSDVIVAGEVIAEPLRASSEAGIVGYAVELKISQLIKGHEVGDRRVGGTIIFSSEQWELEESDRKPELKRGGKFIVFLTCKERQGTSSYTTVDGFLSIQRLSKALAKRLESFVGEAGGSAAMPPSTPEEARKSFYEQAQKFGLLKGRPKEWWTRLAETGEKWHVQKQPYSKALKRVEGTLRADEMAAIVYGKLDDLRTDGECWHVEDLQGFFGLIAYLDAKSGKLVFLWMPPEG
jgi:hypothetical protein